MADKSFHHSSATTSFEPVSFQMKSLLGVKVALPIKFVATDAGFLPLGPCTLFADMVKAHSLRRNLQNMYPAYPANETVWPQDDLTVLSESLENRPTLIL
jgi:hypothetical protein